MKPHTIFPSQPVSESAGLPGRIDTLLASLSRDLYLLVTCPIEYLYSFTYSKEQVATIKPFDPITHRTGNELVKQIQQAEPKLKVYFVGSAALGIAGMKDIDLILATKKQNFTAFTPKLSKLLGKPEKEKEQFIEWKLQKNGCKVEVILLDPTSRMFRLQMEVHHKLMKSKPLREAYNHLKITANGVSVREYQRRKVTFYRHNLQVNHLVI